MRRGQFGGNAGCRDAPTSVSAELESIDLVMRVLDGKVDVRLRVAEHSANAKVRIDLVLTPDAAAGRPIVVARQEGLCVTVAAGIVGFSIDRPWTCRDLQRASLCD